MNKFVNRKPLTSGNTIYLLRNRGGTATPNLYTRYLAMKTSWITKLIIEEKTLMQNPHYKPRPWAEPILTLMKAFNIKFKYLAYAGEADIQFVANIFRQFNLPFWEHLILE